MLSIAIIHRYTKLQRYIIAKEVWGVMHCRQSLIQENLFRLLRRRYEVALT